MIVLIWGVVAACYAAGLGWLLAQGGPWPGLLAQWGEAALAADGSVAFSRFVTAFPPLPYLASTAAQAVGGSTALPGPLLAAALAGGGLAAAWFAGFRRTGIGASGAAAAALALAAHPFTLAIVAAGPGPVMAAGAAWWLGLGMIGLRGTGAVGACVGAAMALCLLPFTEQAGLLLAAAAPLALLVAAPPTLISRGALGLLLLLVFPLLFGLAGFAHVAATHGGAALSFLEGVRPDPLAATPPPTPHLAALLLAGLPMLAALPLLYWRSLPLRQVGAALLLLALAAPILGALAGSPLAAPALAAPALGLGAAALLLLFRRPATARIAAVLLPAGFLAAGAAVALDLDRWREPPAPVAETRALAAAIAGRRGVLVDLAAVPEVAALRGGGAGLIQPEDDAFRLQAMSGRLSAPVVAVRDPMRGPGPWRADRVHAAFPRLHAEGAPGYRLIREIGPWRLYERES
jgi:hypothetical protein